MRSGVVMMSGVLMLGLAACSSPDLSGPPPVDATRLPWTLSLSAHAITMALLPPYDTLQLTAVPRTVDGTALEGAAVTYTSSDSAVRVSSTGLLTARGARDGVRIVASTVYQGIRTSDTAMVSVTSDTAHHIARVQLALQTGDSATSAAQGNAFYYLFYDHTFSFGGKTLLVGALDASDTQIPHSQVELRSSDPSRFSFGFRSARTIVPDPLTVVSLEDGDPGPVTISASATVYGVTRRDSIQLAVTNPLLYIFTFKKSIPAGSTTPVFSVGPSVQDRPLAVGGFVWWNNPNPDDSSDVVFDDPTAASPDTVSAFFNSGGGDIPPYLGASFENGFPFFPGVRVRRFMRAGTFHWHSVKMGVSGTVIVQ